MYIYINIYTYIHTYIHTYILSVFHHKIFRIGVIINGSFDKSLINGLQIAGWLLSRWTYRSVSRCGFSNATPRDTENVKKEICHIFNHNELRITIDANKQTINFLDVTFNLNKNTHQPFPKPYTTLRYVHRGIHAPTTTKDIPAGINKTVIPFIRQSIFRRSRSTKKKALDEC